MKRLKSPPAVLMILVGIGLIVMYICMHLLHPKTTTKSALMQEQTCSVVQGGSICTLPTVFDSYAAVQPVLDTLASAPANTVVLILTAGQGGRVDIGEALIKAMYSCKAKVIVRVIGDVHSMHAMIVLAAPHLEQSLNTSYVIMLHLPYVEDKKNCMPAKEVEESKKIMRRFMTPFYTEEEIQIVLSGKNLLMRTGCFEDRFKAKNKNLACYKEVVTTNNIRQCEVQ